MRYTRNNLPNSRAKLDDFVRQNGLNPYGVVSYKGRDVFLAETDLEMDKAEYPFGYYQTAWFVTAPHSMEKMDGGSWLEFEVSHDMEQGWTNETKRQARLNAALKMAMKWIDQSEEVGRYDA